MCKAQSKIRKFPWWILGVSFVILNLSGFLVWLIRQRRRLLNIDPYIQLESTETATEVKTTTRSVPMNVVEDDLTVIDGIGPRIQSVLKSSGICQYADLAAATPAQLRAILLTAGLRLADPESWPQQAAFAARQDMAGLKHYLEEHPGTRRGRTAKATS